MLFGLWLRCALAWHRKGLQVKYLGLGESDKDAAAVRTNHPIPPSVGHFYFEITIKNKGRDG